jgi:pyridoxamine 5'-phosphate oxidase
MTNPPPPQADEALTERDLDPDPIVQVARWLDDARAADLLLPDAVTLATVDAAGSPSARSVLLRGIDDRGFVFFTNYQSRKARELEANPHAALVLLWKELERQVCVTGTVERTSTEESEAYFRTRPREAKLGAWASLQSRPVGSRDELDGAYREAERRFPGDVPLPPHWGGFRLVPDVIEFWKGRLHRLHDRFRYTRSAGGGWDRVRLWP